MKNNIHQLGAIDIASIKKISFQKTINCRRRWAWMKDFINSTKLLTRISNQIN